MDKALIFKQLAAWCEAFTNDVTNATHEIDLDYLYQLEEKAETLRDILYAASIDCQLDESRLFLRLWVFLHRFIWKTQILEENATGRRLTDESKILEAFKQEIYGINKALNG